MIKIDRNYIFSLSALLQSVYLVNKIATTDYDALSASENLLKSIYLKNTFETKDIYGDCKNLIDGHNLLKQILKGKNNISIITMQKYALNIILIQKNINKINRL